VQEIKHIGNVTAVDGCLSLSPEAERQQIMTSDASSRSSSLSGPRSSPETQPQQKTSSTDSTSPGSFTRRRLSVKKVLQSVGIQL
jgi:hypothetical protein